jgi:hypothetical protein
VLRSSSTPGAQCTCTRIGPARRAESGVSRRTHVAAHSTSAPRGETWARRAGAVGAARRRGRECYTRKKGGAGTWKKGGAGTWKKAARGRCRHESNKWRGDAGCLIGACSVWRPGSGRDRGHGHETGDMVTRQGAWSRGRQGLTGATRQSEYFLVYSKRLFKAGVRMVGGCCGTRSRPCAVLPPRFLRLWRAAATCATEGCMDTRARGAFSRVRRAVVTASARAASRYTWRRCGTDQVQVEDGPGWCIKYSSGAAHAAADYAAAPEWMGSRL